MTGSIFADRDRQRDFDRDGGTLFRLPAPEKAGALAANLPEPQPGCVA